jgi:flagellum-specific peptidoglycan hydrolase FlgJ
MQQTFNNFQVGQIQRYEGITQRGDVLVIDFWKIRMVIQRFFQKNGFTLIALSLMLLLVFAKSNMIDEPTKSSNGKVSSARTGAKTKATKPKLGNEAAAIGNTFQTKNTDPTEGVTEILPVRAVQPVRSTAYASGGNDANLFDNVSIFVAPEKANAVVVKSKKDKCWDYVRRFVGVARAERQKFGIPVSITLAQGLLESDAGDSRLTRAANNHFGVKTFNRHVEHVVMKDDTPTDKFKKYNSAWESYRDHSLLLMRDHYRGLQYLSKTDYAGWARGLEKAGYATDKQYAEKLIKIIENLQLYKLDEA